MAHYVFHFAATAGAYRLTCGRLAQAILGFARGGETPSALPLGAKPGGRDERDGRDGRDERDERDERDGRDGRDERDERDEDDEGDGHNVGDDLQSADLWAQVAALRWALRSDREISAASFADTAAALYADGRAEALRAALARLMRAAQATYPGLKTLGQADLAHLVALGREMTAAAGQSPDLLDFVRGEAQPVDLADWLDG